MTIDEAIERNHNILIEGFDPDDLEDCEALMLGIEALKERQEAINQGLPLWHELLPGETKD